MAEDKNKEAMDRLEISLKRELKRAIRYRESISIILIECHIENDQYRKSLFVPLFKQIAGIIRKTIRDEDTEIILGRNVLLILPMTFLDGAHTVAHKIAKKVKDFKFKEAEGLSDFALHLLFGFANFPYDGSEKGELLEAARANLAESREKLKNKISRRSAPEE
ncbi:MAG: diguanylate cyclase [Candidatus Eremiobacteraeota bacterium]|nr:diguanylate cyclase [Candidatus Eremiobacteraeota bacterium]